MENYGYYYDGFWMDVYGITPNPEYLFWWTGDLKPYKSEYRTFYCSDMDWDWDSESEALDI